MLEEERRRLPKNLNRALYTHRILDITASIGIMRFTFLSHFSFAYCCNAAKQNKEIEKITGDIHTLQKTINAATATLSRSDAVTEELIFRAASSDKGVEDPVMLATYKRLKLMRQSFEELIATVV